jgi:cytochrome c oxidase subunit 2
MPRNPSSLPVSKVNTPRRARWRSRRMVAGGILAALALAGCAGATTTPFLPASTNAKAVYDLFLVVYAIAAVVFVIVVSALLYAAVRFSRDKGKALPPQIEGNMRLEIAWTLAPALVLVVVFIVSLQTLYTISRTQPAAAGQADNSLQVRVIGHRWWWEFVYPTYKITTANDLHVPVDVDLVLEVESADVVHSFWVPQLAGKKDGIPGHANPLYLRVTQTGVYLGECAEYCGTEHADMRLQLIAETSDQFQAWVQAQQAPAAAVSGLAAQGEAVFMKGACIGCHTINGTAAKGMAGPNLTHFASRQTFAGAVLANTHENLAQWLADPNSVKPAVTMPNLHLTSEQISALTAYLEALK